MIISPFIIYFVVINRVIINIPYGDEYGNALGYIDAYNKLTRFHDKLFSLFHQANEHRIFTYTINVLQDYLIFGTLNFKRLLWEGNIWIIVLCFMLYKLNKVDKNNPFIILPVITLVLMPQHEISDWGIVVFGLIVQISLIIGSLYLLSKSAINRLISSIILAFIITFSFGNGMFIFLSGFLILILTPNRKLYEYLSWSFAMIVSIGLYFTDYNFSAGTGFKMEFFDRPVDTIKYFLTFFGSIFSPVFKGNLDYMLISGLIVISYFGYLIFFKWKTVKYHPIALSIMLFILLSAAAASVTRLRFGIGGAAAPRYLLLQAVFLAIIYILTIDVFQKKMKYLLPVILSFSILLFAFRLNHNIKYMTLHRDHLIETTSRYYIDYKSITDFGPPPAMIKYFLDNAKKTGVYYPLPIKELNPDIELMNLPDSLYPNNNLQFSADKFNEYGSIIKLSGWAFSQINYHDRQNIGVFLKSSNNLFIFSVHTVRREDVVKHFDKTYPGLHYNNGFDFVFDKKDFNFPEGTYQIGLCIYENNEIKASQLTKHLINI